MNNTTILFILLCTQVACTGPIKDLPLTSNTIVPPMTDLQIKYLGAGGLYIRRGNDVLLTAPFFSNPTLKRLAIGTIAADPEAIDQSLSSMRDMLNSTQVILVGHAHYDHLMDLPYILSEYTPNALVYGNRTAYHTLAAAVDTSRLIALNDQMGTADTAGKWIILSGGKVRFMAFQSDHAPHFKGITLYKGKREKNLDHLPRRAANWREGQTLSYLIDFMGEDKTTIDFRLYYQDAASNPKRGFPPPLVHSHHLDRIDLALLCVANYDEVRDYPESIVSQLQPRRVVLIHWENFFSRLPRLNRDLRTVPFLNVNKFIKRLEKALPEDSDYILPVPGTWLSLKSRP